MIRPHDLIWIDDIASLFVDGALPDWVAHHWHITLPLVVRRATVAKEFIPVGIRGVGRSQRLACKVLTASVKRVVSPESLVCEGDANTQQRSIMQSLQLVKKYNLPWCWGVTGSCGYQLATGHSTLTDQSDLDLLIRCPFPVLFDELKTLAEFFKILPCRVDAQIETLYGGFALNEWVRDKKALLKTATGPVITDNPWQL